MRWLLLDEVLEIRKGEEARTLSRVPFGTVSPEILMIEMMAQTGGLLLGAETDFQEDLVIAKIERAVFFPGFRQGDLLTIEARCEELRPEGAWIGAHIECSGTRAAECRLLLVNVKRLVPGSPRPVTFHEAYMRHFRIRDRVTAS